MGCLLKSILLPGLMAGVQSEVITKKARTTDKVELESGKLLEIC